MIKKQITLLCFLLMAAIIIAGCGDAAGEREEAQNEELANAATAAELLAFFEEGGQAIKLTADIDMGETMLKLSADRGLITILGEGHTLSSNASSAIRLDDGAKIRLESITLDSEKICIGLLGEGNITANSTYFVAGTNAIESAGAVTLTGNMEISAMAGSGIICHGISITSKSNVKISAMFFALSAGRGNVSIQDSAIADFNASGDNALKTDGTLALFENCHLTVENTGEHNAVRVGQLLAEPSSKLVVNGGRNGVGLFVVHQRQDITLKGSCSPILHLEFGTSKIIFEQ